MANFASRACLSLPPIAPHWREARSAVGAPELLLNANETASLAEAVANCTLVIGTGTLTYRKAGTEGGAAARSGAAGAGRRMKQGGRMALVFGPEKHGLTREDLSHCHLLVEISNRRPQPSMNLDRRSRFACTNWRRGILPRTAANRKRPQPAWRPRPLQAGSSCWPASLNWPW